MENIDLVQLNFSPNTLKALNIILGLVMFGVALELKIADFKIALSRPRAFLIGVAAQFFIFPAVAFGLTRVMELGPSVALGMIMVAACPGGNMSNFFTNLARGSTALSVCMTAVSTTFALIMTPFNLSFWASMDPEMSKVMTDLSIDPLQILGTTFMVMGIPLILGLWISEKQEAWAEKMRKPFKIGSLVFFVLLIVVAFKSNVDIFLRYIGDLFWPVFIMNSTAMALGYGMAILGRLTRLEARAVSIEVGIQNSGLGLVLIFAHFDGLGGMASVAGWWSIWHLITGLTMAGIWSRFFPPTEAELARD